MIAKTALSGLEPHHLLAALGIGAGVRLGGRAVKNLWDMWQDRDKESAVAGKFPKAVPNRAEIPVTVSPEEAKELESGGVHVKTASPGFLGQFMLGAAGTGAAAL